jgi:hypothetical protein
MARLTSEEVVALKIVEAAGFVCARFKPSGDAIPHEEIECAVALFRNLKGRNGRYVAVKVDGPLNWTITEPRTDEALLAALETEDDPTQ